jgi:hypothetical protein
MRAGSVGRAALGAGAFALALLAAPAAQAAGGVERIGAVSGPVSDAVKAALDPQGYHVTLSDGSVDVWLAKEIGLDPYKFVGVLTLPTPRGDFRGQTIRAGTYTLRYAKMPSDGNHMGAAPTTDFLLLEKAADDPDPAANPTWEKLTEASKNAALTNHPAPLNLADASSQKDFPAVAANGLGHEVFYVKLKTAGGAERPIGIVLKGRTDHE